MIIICEQKINTDAYLRSLKFNFSSLTIYFTKLTMDFRQAKHKHSSADGTVFRSNSFTPSP